MKQDSNERYGSVSKIFHWGMALLIFWQALKIFDRIEEGEHWVGQTLVPFHISIGTLLFVLVIFRIIWVAKQQNRPLQNPSMAFLVRAGHFLLYVGMVLMPLTGVLTMLGGGYGLTVFGIQLAARGDEIPWMASVGSLHSPIAWVLLVLIAGHTAMALFHHFIQKDTVLRRMM